jgi:hypothetical protein
MLIIIIIIGLRSVSASEDVIGDPNPPQTIDACHRWPMHAITLCTILLRAYARYFTLTVNTYCQHNACSMLLYYCITIIVSCLSKLSDCFFFIEQLFASHDRGRLGCLVFSVMRSEHLLSREINTGCVSFTVSLLFMFTIFLSWLAALHAKCYTIYAMLSFKKFKYNLLNYSKLLLSANLSEMVVKQFATMSY